MTLTTKLVRFIALAYMIVLSLAVIYTYCEWSTRAFQVYNAMMTEDLQCLASGNMKSSDMSADITNFRSVYQFNLPAGIAWAAKNMFSDPSSVDANITSVDQHMLYALNAGGWMPGVSTCTMPTSPVVASNGAKGVVGSSCYVPPRSYFRESLTASNAPIAGVPLTLAQSQAQAASIKLKIPLQPAWWTDYYQVVKFNVQWLYYMYQAIFGPSVQAPADDAQTVALKASIADPNSS